MPITKSAKKALKGSLKKKVFNNRWKREMSTVVKDIKKLVAEKKTEEARRLLPKAYKIIDKTTKRGVIKKNTASRKKSRLSAFIKKN